MKPLNRPKEFGYESYGQVKVERNSWVLQGKENINLTVVVENLFHIDGMVCFHWRALFFWAVFEEED